MQESNKKMDNRVYGILPSHKIKFCLTCGQAAYKGHPIRHYLCDLSKEPTVVGAEQWRKRWIQALNNAPNSNADKRKV